MVKKISFILVITIISILYSGLISNAEATRIFENEPITVPFSEPILDGKIEQNEGWSKVGYLNEETAGHFYGQMQLTSTTDFYFAYSEEGLYFAASYNEGHAGYSVRLYDENNKWVYTHDYIDANAESYDYQNYPEYTPDGTKIESALLPPAYDTKYPDPSSNAYWYSNGGNTVVYSDGPDDLDNVYGWNGDVIALTIDALSVLDNAGLFSNSDYAIQYNIGIFEGDIVKVCTTRTNNDDITDICKGKGKLTEDNMTFEVFIPWDRIVADLNATNDLYSVEHIFTKNEVISSGAIHRASVTLMDRMYDEEAGYTDSWGRYITVCSVCTDGEDGWKVGANVRGLGLKLIMGEKSGEEKQSAQTTADTTGKSDAVTTKAAETKASNTKKSETEKSSGSASTFDGAIVIPVVLCIIAIIGITAITKKKSK